MSVTNGFVLNAFLFVIQVPVSQTNERDIVELVRQNARHQKSLKLHERTWHSWKQKTKTQRTTSILQTEEDLVDYKTGHVRQQMTQQS
jgi:hypothetical protein